MSEQKSRMARAGELLTYHVQPDNLDASRIGDACSKAVAAPGGGFIDLGLALLRELETKGLGIARISPLDRDVPYQSAARSWLADLDKALEDLAPWQREDVSRLLAELERALGVASLDSVARPR